MSDTGQVSGPEAGDKGRSRRRFIRGVGVVVAGGLLAPAVRPGVGAAATVHPPQPRDLFSHASFAPHRGSRFRIVDDTAGSVDVELIEVSRTAHRLAPQAQNRTAPREGEHFNLVFRGPRHDPLAQETYRFEHSELGAFALFVVPGPPSADGQRYIAVINRPAF